MLIRNVSDHSRLVSSGDTGDFSDDVTPGDTVEVSEAYGVRACEQVENWAPGDTAAEQLVAAAKAEAEAAAVKAAKPETKKQREAREKAEAEAAAAAESEVI